MGVLLKLPFCPGDAVDLAEFGATILFLLEGAGMEGVDGEEVFKASFEGVDGKGGDYEDSSAGEEV